MCAARPAKKRVATSFGSAVVDRGLRLLELDELFADLAPGAPADLLGQPLDRLLPGLAAPLRAVLDTGRQLRRVPLRPGRASSITVRLDPIASSGGTVLGVELTVEPADQDEDHNAPKDNSAARGVDAPAYGEQAHHMHLALEAARMAVWEVDTRTWEVLNATGLDRLFGLEPSEDRRSVEDYLRCVHPDDVPRLRERVRLGLAEGVSQTIEYRVVWPDGSLRWIASRGEFVGDERGLRLIGALLDITERRAAEAELRFQAQLLDAARQGIIATDTAGIVCYWNRFAEQLYGRSREEALGRYILDLVATDHSRQQGEQIMDLLRSGQPWEGTYFMRRADGSTFPVLAADAPLFGPDGTIIGFVGVSIDLSEQLRLEAEREALLLAERAARERADEALALLDTLLMRAPIGLCFLSPDYRYLRINEALAALNGLPVAQHLGHTVREVMPALAPIVEPLFAQVLTTGEPIVEREVIEDKPAAAGGRRIWRASYYPVRLPSGAIAGLGIVANDITSYRLAADALRLSEERFRVALQHSPILVYTTDRELRYTWFYNFPAIFAKTQVLGRRDEDLLAPSEAAKLTALKQRVLARELGERQEVQILIEGVAFSYDVTVEPLHDEGGAVMGLTVAAVDITERRAAEAALRESEARYSALAEAVPAILFTSEPTGANDYVSQNFYDYTGAPPGSGLGRGWAEYLHPDDRARVAQLWGEAVRTSSVYMVEHRFRRHDGVYHWFRVQCVPFRDASGAVVKWFGVGLDINDAKRLEAEREEWLARERAARAAAEHTTTRIARLQAVTAALSEALTPGQVAEVIIAHSVDALGAAGGVLRLISADGRFLDILHSSGVPEDEVARWSRLPLELAAPVCAVARTGVSCFYEEPTTLLLAHPHLENMVRPLSYEAFAVIALSIEGRVLGTLALYFAGPRPFPDEDRALLMAIAGQGAQAIERSRLYDAAREAVEARDSFIAVASHDLRAPLTALYGQAQLLARRAEQEGLPERIVRTAVAIGEQAQRLNRMLGAILDLSRIQTGQLTIERRDLDLAILSARVVADIKPTLSRHRLELVGQTFGLWVAGDEVRLEHVLYNLLGNAVKYSPRGGTVTVYVGRRDGQACVTVSDQGIGIPAEALPRLFERFFRATNSEAYGIKGMGIGLYAVREILTLHGGTIKVTSEEGVGSDFTILLPLKV